MLCCSAQRKYLLCSTMCLLCSYFYIVHLILIKKSTHFSFALDVRSWRREEVVWELLPASQSSIRSVSESLGTTVALVLDDDAIVISDHVYLRGLRARTWDDVIPKTYLLCSMLLHAYYAHFNAGIISSPLPRILLRLLGLLAFQWDHMCSGRKLLYVHAG